MANSGVSFRVVRTELDRIANAIWSKADTPDVASVKDELVFHQIPVSLGSQQEQVFAGSGYWDQRGEQQNMPSGESLVNNKVTVVMSEFARQERVSRWFFEDAQFNLVEKIVSNMIGNGRQTQDLRAFEIYRGATAGTLTSDALSLLNNAHTLINSAATVDNLETDRLTDGVLNTLITRLMEQPGQDGVVRGSVPRCLLVPTIRHKLATELNDSEWSAQTANNAINVYRSKYGIMVKHSPFLGSAISAGTGISAGSNDLCFLLGDTHEVNRYLREDLKTDTVDYKYQVNNDYIYKAYYRENYSAIDFLGVVGTSGTTGAYA